MQRVVVEHEGGEEVFGITHVEGTTFMVYRNTDPKDIRRAFVESPLTAQSISDTFGVADPSLAADCAELLNGAMVFTEE